MTDLVIVEGEFGTIEVVETSASPTIIEVISEGPTGPEASVTSEKVIDALGYTPMSDAYVPTWEEISDKPSFSGVAQSGSYNDLSDKPPPYSLPASSPTTLGGVKIDDASIRIVDGIISTSAEAIGLTAPDGSGLVGFSQIGAGAVDRTIESKLRDIITDADYSGYQTAAIAALGKVFTVPANSSVVLTVGVDTANLADAISAIQRWIIPASSTVTIKVPSAALTQPTTFAHAYGDRVFITGLVAKVTATATAAGAVTGAAGAWSVPITVASAAGIQVNDYAILSSVTGTGAYKQFSGLCKVSSVVGTTVTVLNTDKSASWASATLTGATLTVVKNIITYTGCDGLRVDSKLGGLSNIILVGNKTAGTIGLITNRMCIGGKNKGYVYCGGGYGTGVAGFGDGGVYAQYGGVVDGACLAVADCLIYNVYSQHGGHVMMNDGISSGCAEAGIAASNSGDISFERGVSVGNGTYGIFEFSSGSVLAKNAFVWHNVADGWRTSWGGALRADNLDSRYNGGSGGFNLGASAILPNAIMSNNGSNGITCEGGGSVYANNLVADSNLGHGIHNDGSVFDAPSSTLSSNGINGLTTTNGGVSLCNLLSGSGNGTYLSSTTKAGYVRATNASASGQTFYVDNHGFVDATGATGSPTITVGAGGKALNASGVLIWGAISNVDAATITASTSLHVGGATKTALFQVRKDSLYNSEGSAAFSFQNSTSPLKQLVGGYDGVRDYSYLQSVNSTNGYKPLALNPNAGNVGIGLGTTSPAARLHLPAGAAAAGNGPFKLTPGTNLTTPSDGVLEYDGTNLTFTIGTTRKTFVFA